MMLVGAVICCFSGVFGILLSWHLSIAPSAAIVLTMTFIFLLAYVFSPRRGLVKIVPLMALIWSGGRNRSE